MRAKEWVQRDCIVIDPEAQEIKMPTKPLSDEKVIDSSDNESENEQQKLTNTPSTVLKASTTTASKDQTSAEESDTDDVSSSSEGSESSSTLKRKAISNTSTSISKQSKRLKLSETTVRRVEASTHLPPTGYSKLDSVNSNDTDALFENVNRKQIWHITAPASLKISELSNIDLSASLKGQPILESNGTTYVIKPLPTANASVLSARGKDATFVSVQPSITRTLRIQESSRKSTNTDNTSAQDNSEADGITFFATSINSTREPRKQPSNLKGRYVPFGLDHQHKPVQNADIMDIDDLEPPTTTSQPTSQAVFTPSKTKKKSKQKATS